MDIDWEEADKFVGEIDRLINCFGAACAFILGCIAVELLL